MSKLKLWDAHQTWEAAEATWNAKAQEAEKSAPIKKLKILPSMPGISDETAKNLKWKSLKWMITQDHDFKVLKSFMRHPFRYTYAYLKSLWKGKSYTREGDFFLYGIPSLAEFERLFKNPDYLFVLGFSYCHKPLECPSGRFTDQCVHDLNNPTCQQCFIGKMVHASTNVIPLFIPTVHYIGGKILDILHANPGKELIFMITACEMTLEMFGDWGNMAGIKGLGVRLDGRICNTMKAFELSEKGIKPGLTVVLDETQSKMLELMKIRRKELAKSFAEGL